MTRCSLSYISGKDTKNLPSKELFRNYSEFLHYKNRNYSEFSHHENRNNSRFHIPKACAFTHKVSVKATNSKPIRFISYTQNSCRAQLLFLYFNVRLILNNQCLSPPIILFPINNSKEYQRELFKFLLRYIDEILCPFSTKKDIELE